ncbi:ribosomal RNA-processing protein 12 [[Candida] anglica]|uniref:Ribosomal RNA-processing protein 12 n=1 Tax=[Candida] anglica TaxID=148631 RepID=A0ABP0EBY5_9ASCO
MSETNPDGGASVDVFIMEDKLAKIRTQVNSKLDNQKNLALILSAVEENIEEQKNEKTPVAYFVSFLSLMDQCVGGDEIVDAGLATSAAYFLDLVFPFTPQPLLRSRFADILTKLAPPLTSSEAEAPLVRSTIGALETLLLAQDHHQWTSNNASVSPRRALVGLLELSFDPRPKVRRRAQDAVKSLLSNPPASPSPVHVAAPLCGELALNRLVQLMKTRGAANKKEKANTNTQIIHCLQLVASITASNAWPQPLIGPLCDSLLEVSKTSDQYLVSSAFQAFEGLFQSMSSEVDLDKFTKCLDVIFDLKPPVNDTHLAASWLAVVAKALESFAKLSPSQCLARVALVAPIVASFLASESKDIYVSASQCLIAIVSESISDEQLVNYEDESLEETITFLAEFTEKELLSIKYQHATQEILEFVTATLLKLRTRANPDFLNVIQLVGDWRTNERASFPNKAAEDVLSAAISTLGPDVVLSVLPLNLAGESGPGRAWLLPLLRDNVRFANLNFFKSNILPLVEVYQGKINPKEETMHNKIFQTIIDQVWSLLPHFCDLPKDLTKAFDDQFAAQLSDLMYSNIDLRVPICHALKLLVESNIAYSEGALADDLLMQQEFPIEQSKLNLAHLASKAANILSVLFNVFSSTVPGSRGFVLETIDAYLQVIPKTDLENTFNKVCGLLKNAMDEEAKQTTQAAPKSDSVKLSATMMDLIVAMAKYVPETSHNALFSIFSATVALPKDALLQKRSYRIITKIVETDGGKESVVRFLGDIEQVLVSTTETTHNSARASRLAAIHAVLDLLPNTDLHFIPAVLQEIIMSTKDVNEKTRELSYQILIQMGHKMSQGGIVENGKVPGFDPETPSSEASLTEFFTMVSAGLAAQTPHMISATITAVSCLVFEFKDQLDSAVLLEIASTVELFLTHNSREIAKSAIGFVKVEVLSLPEDIVRANLNELLAKLMRWSHEHKGHFKSKVKHILERLIRKFGVEVVEQAIPEEDRKLVANIKKSRNRAKRKEEEEEAGASTATGTSSSKFTSAYEEALYDSDDSDDEDEAPSASSGSSKKANQFIMESADEPLNLLDRQAMAHISSSKPKKFGKKDLASKTTVKDGKFVFREGKDEDPLANKGSGIDAYVDAIKQAPVRGQRNKLKYKNSKTEDDWSDSEGEEEKSSKKNKGGKKFVNKSKISKPQPKFKARKKL